MTVMKQSLRRLAGALLVSVTVWLPAAAQDSADLQALQDRLQRLDRDLMAVQQRVYRGGAATSTAPSQAAAPPSDAQTAATVNLQTRISGLESELRKTTGQIEEANFAVGNIRQRLDRLVTDLDSRLAALEKAFAERPPAPSAAITPVAAPSATKPGAPAAAPVPPVKLPKGSAKDQYEFAFDLLKRSEYGQAESALKQFVAAHPTDPLAPNAQYWLAETFFVRNDFAGAAAQFLAGYQKYPQAPKAPDTLVKLGLSLAKLNKTPEACAAFARFQKEYPTATGALRGRVSDERQRLKCS
jgi:tol-pal system protein YbgF